MRPTAKTQGLGLDDPKRPLPQDIYLCLWNKLLRDELVRGDILKHRELAQELVFASPPSLRPAFMASPFAAPFQPSSP